MDSVTMASIAIAQLGLTACFIAFYVNYNKEQIKLEQKIYKLKTSLDYVIRKTFIPKYSMGQKVKYYKVGKYTSYRGEGKIVDISVVDFDNKEFNYTIYSEGYNPTLVVMRESDITIIQTPQPPSGSAHKSPDQSPE